MNFGSDGSRKAKYIVLEGMDGSGKTTQARMLAEFLSKNGFKVFSFSEPTNNVVGRLISGKLVREKAYSPETIALAFATDRMLFKDEVLTKALEEYDFVIGDRSYHSSLVYQPLMGLDYHWVKELNRFVIRPDLTMILDITMDEYMRRKGNTEIIFEKRDFQERVRQRYLQLPEMLPAENFVVLDGNRSVEEIHRDIKKRVLML